MEKVQKPSESEYMVSSIYDLKQTRLYPGLIRLKIVNHRRNFGDSLLYRISKSVTVFMGYVKQSIYDLM
jgi:hypothetical protein